MTEKYCPKCDTTKDVALFGKHSERNDGLQAYCKECSRKTAAKRYADKPDSQKLANNKYRKYNADLINASVNTWRNNNPDKVREQNKRRDKSRLWVYYRKRRSTDLNYRITANLRARISIAVKRNSAIKEPTKELLGCDIPALRLHLEERFTDGMSWGNYGEWEIDHIKPCSAFDLTLEAQRFVCFNYQNLQPLWKADNIKKGGIKVSP